MFTGIVQAKGTIIAAADGRFTIVCPWDAGSIVVGSSICCDGCCLTAATVTPHTNGAALTFDVSNETLGKTTLGTWQPGRDINLERSLRAGDELGGHLVSGHVDGVANIEDVSPSGFSKIFKVSAPDSLAKYIAPKGSVALNGVSLTVNEIFGSAFFVNLIPTTLDITTWGSRKRGDNVNVEVDLIARYVARLLGH
ncbi:MAG: riboflavin synthase [Rhodomicrobium sp.]